MSDGSGRSAAIGRRSSAILLGCAFFAVVAGAAPAGAASGPPAPPVVQERIDLDLRYHFHDCWRWAGRESADYVPMLRIRLSGDGRVVGDPTLYNLPMGPEQSRLAADVLDHVRRCAPLRVTPEMQRYPRAWQDRIIRFDTRPDPEGGP